MEFVIKNIEYNFICNRIPQWFIKSSILYTNTTVYCSMDSLDLTCIYAMRFVDTITVVMYYSHTIIIMVAINQNFTHSTQSNHIIPTNQAIVMIFVPLERRELGLFIDTTNVKFKRIDAKLHRKANGLFVSEKVVYSSKTQDIGTRNAINSACCLCS